MQRVRTTITLPGDLLQAVKIIAVQKKKPLSTFIQIALEKEIGQPKPKKDLMSLMGKFSFDIEGTLSRKEIYAEHLKHIMPS